MSLEISRRVPAMEFEVWDDDFLWMAQDLQLGCGAPEEASWWLPRLTGG
jgi:hypothetical protein